MFHLFQAAQDLLRRAARAPVRLQHHLQSPLLRVRRSLLHQLVVILILRRIVGAERQHELDAHRLPIVDLLACVLDLLRERQVELDAQRAHVHRQAARGNPLL